MEKTGFNNLATSIALERLKKRGMTAEVSGEDDRGESYRMIQLTPLGREWLLDNEDLFELLTPAAQSERDIPF